MKLNDAQLRSLKIPGKHADGYGLYLEVTAAGGRYWRLKYRFGGKEKRLAFGVYPTVGLKLARERRDEARKLLDQGLDPGEVRKAASTKTAEQAVHTFESVAREWHAHQSGKWDAGTKRLILASIETHLFPDLGAKPIATVSARDVIAAVQKVEAKGATDMAGRVLQRAKAIFRYAVVHGRVEANPTTDLVPSEILKPRRTVHRAALTAADLPDFFKRFAAYDGDPHTIAALWLLMLTAVRPGEVRGARWDEFDLTAGLWRIPAERMKMRIEHVVPLSPQAREVVQGMKPFSGTGVLVFPSPFYPKQPLSENTINAALARMGYKGAATAHGFRSLFSTTANEAGWNPDAIERQLAHVERNQVRAAYDRGARLKERGELMLWWADHLTDVATAGFA